MRAPPILIHQTTSLNKLLIFETFYIHFDYFKPYNVTILHNIAQIVI